MPVTGFKQAIMMHSSLISLLNQFKTQKFFFEPLGGNNGDKLIEMGAREVFNRSEIIEVNTLKVAEVIVINGSGDLSYHPVTKPIEETKQASLLTKYPGIPVILLPSSCTQANAERLKPIVLARNASTFLFARDAISYSYLKELETDSTKVFLDHDMAFALRHTDLISRTLQVKQKETLLIVERFDAEGATALPLVYKTNPSLRSLIPESIKKFIKKRFLGLIHGNTGFVKEAAMKAKEYFPALGYKSIKGADISLPQNHTFDEFCAEIGGSAIVISTRLHVCIFAAMLGKPFIAVQFEGGSKLKGVFEHSLKQFPNSRLWIRKRV